MIANDLDSWWRFHDRWWRRKMLNHCVKEQNYSNNQTSVPAGVLMPRGCLLSSQGFRRRSPHRPVWICSWDQWWVGCGAGQYCVCTAEGCRQLGICGLQWKSKSISQDLQLISWFSFYEICTEAIIHIMLLSTESLHHYHVNYRGDLFLTITWNVWRCPWLLNRMR